MWLMMAPAAPSVAELGGCLYLQLLRELPEVVVVPCGPAPDDENVRCDTVAYRSAATGVRVRASTAAIMDWLQPASVLWHAAGTDCPTGAALRA